MEGKLDTSFYQLLCELFPPDLHLHDYHSTFVDSNTLPGWESTIPPLKKK
jgi:hypothetical protein